MAGANDPYVMQQAVEVNKLIQAAGLAREAHLAEQAAAVGFDPETWRLLVERDPELADTLVANRASVQAQALRTGARAHPSTTQYQPQLGEFSMDRLQAAINAGISAEEMARTLVPEDKRTTHVLLYNAPGPDGIVYGTSLVPKAQAQRKIESGSFSALPRGPLDPGPQLVCDMVVGFGGRCGKRMRTAEDLYDHKRFKHARTFEAGERLAAAESRRLEAEERRALIGYLQQQGRSAGAAALAEAVADYSADADAAADGAGRPARRLTQPPSSGGRLLRPRSRPQLGPPPPAAAAAGGGADAAAAAEAEG